MPETVTITPEQSLVLFALQRHFNLYKKQALRFIRNRGLVFQPFSFISADFDQIVIRVTHIKALHFP